MFKIAKQIILTQNNTGIGIVNTFIGADKEPINITGYTCTLDLVYPDNSTVKYPIEVIDSVNGKTLFILGLEETSQIGLHKLYFNLIDANSHITAQNMSTYYVLAEKGGV